MEIERSECRHHIISRLLKEGIIPEVTMKAELEKFPNYGHRTIWHMYYREIVRRWNLSKSYDLREYHWVLNISSPELTNPKSEWYFEDKAKEVEAQREANRIYFSKLNKTNQQNESNNTTA